ncbi:MAG: DNA-binding protein WhiA [Bacilli bacterium]|nr:DNA-binding protein WhiA [Bacilli bacterium]
MSFASDVKKEISNIQGDDCCLKAELYSIIKYRATIKISSGDFKIEIVTTLNSIARRIVYLYKKLYNIKLEIILVEQKKLNYKDVYVLTTTEKGLYVLKDLNIIDDNYEIKQDIAEVMFTKKCCKISVLRGAFMVRGSLNDPKKSNYHLEIVAMNQNDADFLIKILGDVGIVGKSIVRSKGVVVYLKKAEQIADFLRYIGATNSLFYFEDERIRRDYSNYANRTINCDIANEEKAITTAARQLKNIAYIENNYGLLNLSERLTDAVLLRNTYPDDSLSQLSEKSEELIGRYISKSGLSHCFKDIERMCIQIKKDKK